MLKIRRVPVASLILDPDNAREHDEANLDSITGSLTMFGQVEPLVVNKQTGIVVGGNGRLAALKAMGVSEVDIVEVSLEPAKAKALALALNRTAELANWNSKKLLESLKELDQLSVDLESLGFSELNVPDFDPTGEDEQGRLDEKKKAVCPKCAHEFTP